MLRAVNQSIFNDLLDSSGAIKLGKLHRLLLLPPTFSALNAGSEVKDGGFVSLEVGPEHVTSDACQFVAFATI